MVWRSDDSVAYRQQSTPPSTAVGTLVTVTLSMTEPPHDQPPSGSEPQLSLPDRLSPSQRDVWPKSSERPCAPQPKMSLLMLGVSWHSSVHESEVQPAGDDHRESPNRGDKGHATSSPDLRPPYQPA